MRQAPTPRTAGTGVMAGSGHQGRGNAQKGDPPGSTGHQRRTQWRTGPPPPPIRHTPKEHPMSKPKSAPAPAKKETPMTDMIPADKVRDLRDQYARLIEDAGTKEAQAYYGHVVKDLDALLPTPPPLPTLADMTEEERVQHVTGQVDVNTATFTGRGILVGFDSLSRVTLKNAHAMILTRDWKTIVVDPKDVTPRPDLPPLEWPDEPEAEDVTPSTLARGSEWGDIDALTQACETSGRDQITVIDCDGDVSVWNGISGWWQTGTPYGYEPYTILHPGKGADQ